MLLSICHTMCGLADVQVLWTLSRNVCRRFLEGILSDFRDCVLSSFLGTWKDQHDMPKEEVSGQQNVEDLVNARFCKKCTQSIITLIWWNNLTWMCLLYCRLVDCRLILRNLKKFSPNSKQCFKKHSTLFRRKLEIKSWLNVSFIKRILKIEHSFHLTYYSLIPKKNNTKTGLSLKKTKLVYTKTFEMQKSSLKC